MPVVINEIEQTVMPEASRAQGGGAGNASSNGGTGAGGDAARAEMHILAAIEKDAARHARLWAD